MKKRHGLISPRMTLEQSKGTLGRISGPPSEKLALYAFLEDVDAGLFNFSSHQSCPSCGGVDITILSEIDRHGVPCEIVICDGCCLIFNNMYISERYGKQFYSDYWGKIKWCEPEKNFLKRTREDSFAYLRKKYIKEHLPEYLSINKVLEIGCGDGCNLYPWYKAGCEIVGFDYDDKFLSIGRAHGMENLHVGGIDDALRQYAGWPDLVILSHVFEHFEYLDHFISKLYDLIPSHASVYVEVPGIKNWVRPLSKRLKVEKYSSTNNLLEYLQFQHNYNFELCTLVEFWERNNFYLVNGDEWVRSIFKKGSIGRAEISCGKADCSALLSQLRSAEKSYNSIYYKFLYKMKIIIDTLRGRV